MIEHNGYLIPNGKALTDTNSGFFPLNKKKVCKDSCHNPPSHMVIPDGYGYRHVCPSCGAIQTIIPAEVTL